MPDEVDAMKIKKQSTTTNIKLQVHYKWGHQVSTLKALRFPTQSIIVGKFAKK
jgi:hypothetical protein